MKKLKHYESPEMEIIEVHMEHGFAASGNTTPDFGFGGDLSGGNY